MSIARILKLPFHPESGAEADRATREFGYGLARAMAGGIIFSLPMLMTQEMWRLGQTIPAENMALLLVVTLPLLFGLSRLSGFKRTGSWLQDAVDVFVAYAVGVAASALVLAILGRVTPDLSLRAITGMLTLQTVPTSMGALLAQSQFGQHDEDDVISSGGGGYWSELLVMASGALFLGFNVAPTDEVIMVAHSMSTEALLLLAVLSLLSMHAFVYAVEFRGQEAIPEGGSPRRAFLLLTVTGYALVLCMSAFLLWTFGRFSSSSITVVMGATVVLAFPASIGAAAARLIL
ncbi:MAG TPA: TIGR02587 family membrane protein [Gemmatimonadales bacterium]|nr:TIGR02587 family membrane protein [Gemmatimonadales bacterium]